MRPSSPHAEHVRARWLDRGLIVLTCGPDGNVLRLIPPFTLTDEELAHGLTIVDDVVAAVS